MLNAVKKFFARTDWILLALCVLASVYGIIMISSAVHLSGAGTYVMKQLIALFLGLAVYFLISFVDLEVLAEHQLILIIFGALFLASLAVFGTAGTTGNRSWLHIPGLPFNIQPAEYCKLIYIIAVARITSVNQEHINSPRCVTQIAALSILFLGLIVGISQDAGVALIYVFAFLVMAIAGGFHFLWFLGAGALLVVVVPIAWNSGLIRDDQKARLQVLWDSSIDPTGISYRWQSKRSLSAITGGGFTGEGLFHGTQTQADNIPEQHTDFIFAVIGEELGFIGCVVCIAILLAITIRIIWIGVHSGSFFYRQVCIGVAGTLMFQIIINIGMCIGMMPVIGVTLPFFSYGGSSMLSLFMSMGLISSIRLHPSPDYQQRYISLPIG